MYMNYKESENGLIIKFSENKLKGCQNYPINKNLKKIIISKIKDVKTCNVAEYELDTTALYQIYKKSIALL